MMMMMMMEDEMNELMAGSRIALGAMSIQLLQHCAKCPTYEPGGYMIKSISVCSCRYSAQHGPC